MHILVDLNSVLKDTTNPPGTAWRDGNEPYLTFDDTTDELFKVQFTMPQAANNGILIFDWKYSMASDTTNVVAVRVQVKAVTDGESITSATYDTLEATSDNTVPGTAGFTKTITHTITNVDSIAASDYVVIEFGRENATSGTNATGDMNLESLMIRVS